MGGSLVFHAIVLFVALPPQPSQPPGGASEALEVRLLPAAPEPGVRNPDIQDETRVHDLELPGTEPPATRGAPRAAASPPPGETTPAAVINGAYSGELSSTAGPPSAAYEAAVPAEAISPDYPSRARRRRQEGEVRLRLAVDALGTVREVSVLVSSGVPALDSAALKAASSASFRPARANGTAVSSSLRLTVVFALEADSDG